MIYVVRAMDIYTAIVGGYYATATLGISNPVNRDLKKLLNVLKTEGLSDRTKKTIYVSASVFEDFRKLCGDVAASRVLEEWMRQALEDAKSKK
jgi:hypothetical protein